MIIKAEWNGQEQEFEVLGGEPNDGSTVFYKDHATHIFNNCGSIKPVLTQWRAYMYLRLINKRHSHGGVVFEETGEVRKARYREWYLDNGRPTFGLYSDEIPEDDCPILRPVAIKDATF